MGKNTETEAAVQRALALVQSDRRVRVALAVLLVLVLVGVAARSIWALTPRHYTLTISGGDIVSNRHFLARLLQSEAPKHDLTLVVEPVSSGADTLDRLSLGELDVAFVEGGLDKHVEHVEHLATVMPEFVHLLVQPSVTGMADLKGHAVNLGPKNGAARSISLTLLRFAGYVDNVDFVETNYTNEQLLGLPLRKMPDAILTLSSVPSFMVEILVKKHGYAVVEIPFPEALALRHGWAADGTILAYTYDLSPPVPPKNISTVAVSTHLLANAKADPAALERLLEVLYSPGVSSRLLQAIDERRMKIPSGYPLSLGMVQYVTRNDTIFTVAMWHKLQGLIGLVMSFSGVAVVIFRWLKGAPMAVTFDDGVLLKAIDDVLNIERAVLAIEAAHDDQGNAERNAVTLQALRERLGALTVQVLERFPTLELKDPKLVDQCLFALRSARQHVDHLVAAADTTAGRVATRSAGSPA